MFPAPLDMDEVYTAEAPSESEVNILLDAIAADHRFTWLPLPPCEASDDVTDSDYTDHTPWFANCPDPDREIILQTLRKFRVPPEVFRTSKAYPPPKISILITTLVSYRTDSRSSVSPMFVQGGLASSGSEFDSRWERPSRCYTSWTPLPRLRTRGRLLRLRCVTRRPQSRLRFYLSPTSFFLDPRHFYSTSLRAPGPFASASHRSVFRRALREVQPEPARRDPRIYNPTFRRPSLQKPVSHRWSLSSVSPWTQIHVCSSPLG